MSWLCLKAQAAIASGDILFPEKPVTTEGCHYHFTPKEAPTVRLHLDAFVNSTELTHTEWVLLFSDKSLTNGHRM